MNGHEFEAVVREQMQMCEDILGVKAGEYASDKDRLHNFMVAANLQGVHPRQALAGMMSKHTVSVYDLCHEAEINRNLGLWNEKITDSINYLLLLKATVLEELGELGVPTMLNCDPTYIDKNYAKRDAAMVRRLFSES